jgi:hypothetical protein
VLIGDSARAIVPFFGKSGLFSHFAHESNKPLLYRTSYKPWHSPHFILLKTIFTKFGFVTTSPIGTNCGFEDCFWMGQLLDKGGEWEEIFDAFDKLRRPNGVSTAFCSI